MEEKGWITLSDYSNKYGVSISTLRRRIKIQRVEFVYKSSKYFLLDKPLGYHRGNNLLDNSEGDSGVESSRGAKDFLEKPKTNLWDDRTMEWSNNEGANSSKGDSHSKLEEPLSQSSRSWLEPQKEVLDNHVSASFLNLSEESLNSHTGKKVSEGVLDNHPGSLGLDEEPSKNSDNKSYEEYPDNSLSIQGIPLESPQGWRGRELETLSQSISHLDSDRAQSMKKGFNQNPDSTIEVTIAPPHKASDCHLKEQTKEDSSINKEVLFIARQLEKAIKPHVNDVLATTNRLLDEIKKTYSLILQEKEEEIILMRDEMANLKTLVCVLEDENKNLCEELGKDSQSWSQDMPTV